MTDVLDDLRAYTIDISKLLGIDPVGKWRNSYGPYAEGAPSGAITHYTASNQAVGPKRPYGRLPILLERFKPRGRQGVGVQFVVWDGLIPRFKDIRARYPSLSAFECEVFFFGLETFWHAGWANSWSYGIEIRNCGYLLKSSGGSFLWGDNRYVGRDPAHVGESWWEPFTVEQLRAAVQIHRIMAKRFHILPSRFLGHFHITSSRRDPGPMCSIETLRRYALMEPDVPLNTIVFPDAIYDAKVNENDLFPDDIVRRDRMDATASANASKVLLQSQADIDKAMTSLSATPARILEAKLLLHNLGYYVGDPTTSDPNESFLESLRIFEARWTPHGEIKIVGKLDDSLLAKMRGYAKRIGVGGWDVV